MMSDAEFYTEVCNRLLAAREELLKATVRRIAAQSREAICRARMAHYEAQIETIKYRDSLREAA
jgi:hypothetical protein